MAARVAALVERQLCPKTGVLTLAFANERKLNAWTKPLMLEMQAALAEAKSEADVRGVVVTGRGKYYVSAHSSNHRPCPAPTAHPLASPRGRLIETTHAQSAGVDLSALIKPMAPSKLIRQLRDSNQGLFQIFLDYPKPIAAAVNGPAIGAAVTSTILMDRVVAGEAATFSLPFAKLGVPPEGCSSHTFPERMGEAAAQRMLGEENWVPSAAEALAAGLIDEVVPGGNEEVVARAVAVVAERVAAGGARRFDAPEHARLSRINAVESARLANAFVSPAFLEAMRAFNEKRGKAPLAYFFAAARAALPLWRPAEIEPDYGKYAV